MTIAHRTHPQEGPMSRSPFHAHVSPNWQGLVRCIRRQGAPDRVHHFELFLDQEIQTAVCKQFGLLDGLNADDLHFAQKRQVCLQRFLGYGYVRYLSR